MKYFSRMRILGLVLVACGLLAGGCSEEDSPVVPGTGGNIPDSGLPFPETPDQVMTNFLTVYKTTDLAEYELMLDPGFTTKLQPATVQEYHWLGLFLNVDEERQCHLRLFSGDDTIDVEGFFLPGIESFDFAVFSKVVDWGVSLPTDPVPDTLSALYDVRLIVYRGEQNPQISVSGRIRFYVEPATGKVNGVTKTYYRLIHQIDLTEGGKATEQLSWGSLKALYF